MNRLPSLSSVVALAGIAVAQAPVPVAADSHLQPPVAAQAACIPVHSHATEPGEQPYGTWAAGRDYKARFDGGMTFVPQLGRDYPQNQPFAWRTTSVRVGAQELLNGRAPAMTHTDLRVEYAHGAVVEAYDVLPNGLEQTFTLAHRPAAAGDLVIRGAVTASLWTPAVEEQVGALVFRDANGASILSYGAAVAVDADGDRFVMTTSCVDNTITLRLPAAELARADFPLVVDPLLSTQVVHTIGTVTQLGEIDAACETNTPSYGTAFAYTRHFSATDSDIEVRVGVFSLLSNSLQYSDVSASASADNARLAYVAATNRWVVVYQNLVTSSQLMQLRAATFLAGGVGAPVATSIPHLMPLGTHEWRPSVGGIVDGGSGTQVLVVFQQELGTTPFVNTANSRVMGMLFNTTTALGSWGTPFSIESGASLDVERPSVNRSGEGGTFSWFVACQRYDNSIAGDDWDLVGRLVSNAGVVSANAWTSSLGTTHQLGPVVDGRNGRFTVAVSTASPSIGKNLDRLGTAVCCERLDWAHGGASPSATGNYPAETLATNAFRLLEATGIAHDGATRSHWAIVWRSSTTSPAVYATRVGYRGKPLQSPDLVAATGATTPGVAAVVHNDQLDGTTIGFQVENGTADVWSRMFSLPVAVGDSLSATNCSNAPLEWNGVAATYPGNRNQRIGCEFSSVRTFNAPANSLHLMLVALAPANVPVSDPILGSNCSLLVPFTGPDYLGNMPLAVGNDVSWQLPLPETLPVVTLYFQDWILDPATNLFAGSRRLTVPLAK